MKTENVMQVSIQVPDDQSTLQVHQAPQRPNLPISDALQIKAAEYWLNGKTELHGGSKEDRLAAHEWNSLFWHEAVVRGGSGRRD